ncbi:MAG TPA: hypothetical protein VHA37_06250 [Candidatus Saccharimonadales bacterium]|nr:hypothetical protein [Candidatus Saccharimonadales bacterium]
MRHKGRQPYSLLTVNGRVHLWRIRWHDSQEGSQTPTDALLDAAERAISEGVREMACRLNRGATSFQHTADNLARAAHLEVSKETLRQLIEQEGRAVLQAHRRGELASDWQASDCRTESGTTRVYLGADGVMVPLITDGEKKKRREKVRQKRQRSGRRCRPLPPRKEGADQQYKEFKVVTFYDENQEHRYVNATSGDHSVAGRMMQRMALQIDLKKAEEKIGNVDGSPWIRNEIEFYGLVDAVGLDYYHLRDNVQKTRLVVYGEDNPVGQAWKKEMMGLFYEQGYEAVWESLIGWRRSLRGAKRREADRLLGYIAQRRDMIRYPEFRQRGWQIGSGPTEAQCKTSTQRLKGRGRRWDRANAEALMALDCLESSNAWHLYWTTLDPERN